MGIDQFFEIYRLYLLEFIPVYDVYTTGRKINIIYSEKLNNLNKEQ